MSQGVQCHDLPVLTALLAAVILLTIFVMQSMGLKIDSLQISEIHDPSGC